MDFLVERIGRHWKPRIANQAGAGSAPVFISDPAVGVIIDGLLLSPADLAATSYCYSGME
jgi:hypothetical protein